MSRPLFAGKYLQVTWWAPSQWKWGENASNDNVFCLAVENVWNQVFTRICERKLLVGSTCNKVPISFCCCRPNFCYLFVFCLSQVHAKCNMTRKIFFFFFIGKLFFSNLNWPGLLEMHVNKWETAFYENIVSLDRSNMTWRKSEFHLDTCLNS